ncbi:hypothetical protein BJ165DRAFT_1456908 [Panaeolus papilionaceus]|nr:hypothetical protein BJ165DRAFT_1456908 [Panaeolus papilionaceus]
MPSFQTYFKDTAPVIVYSDEWHAITSEDDPLLDHYTERTATGTNATGATMLVRFFGNHVGIYGARRPSHGLFSVEIDGKTYPSLNASSSTPLFNQTLFNATLDNAQHTMIMTNLGNTTLDVDYVAFDASVGTEDEKLGSDTFQDPHPSFEYSGKWVSTQRPGSFSGSNAHVTIDTNASVRHTFQGTAIFLYGAITPTACKAYSVSLDGGPFEVYSARKRNAKPRQLYYHRAGLGPGRHNILVQFNTTDNSTIGDFDLDFSNAYILPSLGGSIYTVKPFTDDSHDLPRSAVIGLSIVSIIAFLALLGVGFLLFKQKRQSKDSSKSISSE